MMRTRTITPARQAYLDRIPAIRAAIWAEWSRKRLARRAEAMRWHGVKHVMCGACGRTYETHKMARVNARCHECEVAAEQTRGLVTGMVAKAVRQGILPHPSTLKCSDCGIQASEYDHRDYSQPLQVAPVCRGCNVRRGPGAPFNRFHKAA